MTLALAITGALCVVFGIILVLALVFGALFGNQIKKAPGELGAKMQLQKVVSGSGFTRGDWYGGQYEGRPFALTFVTQKVRGYRVESGTRTTGVPTLRIAMPVFREGGQAIDVRRMVQNQREFVTFEEAYPKQKGVEQLGVHARDVLFSFARDQGALRVKDWAGHPRQTMPAELGFTGSWVVYHDELTPDLAPPPSLVQERVRALHELALVLEGADH